MLRNLNPVKQGKSNYDCWRLGCLNWFLRIFFNLITEIKNLIVFIMKFKPWVYEEIDIKLKSNGNFGHKWLL